MKNTNIERTQVVENPALCVNNTFCTEQLDEDKPMTTEEEMKFMENIDTKALDKIIDRLETQMDNPDAWVTWEDAKKRLRRYD